jgi:hypothetical protein
LRDLCIYSLVISSYHSSATFLTAAERAERAKRREIKPAEIKNGFGTIARNLERLLKEIGKRQFFYFLLKSRLTRSVKFGFIWIANVPTGTLCDIA